MPLKYAFFDMDNTIALSEKLAFEACSDLTNELLEKHNIEARYTGESLLHTFVGMNFRGMMVALQTKHNFSIPDAEIDEYVDREVDAVVAKLLKYAEPCPGAPEQLKKLKEEGKYPMAVVSTSAKPRVVASLEKLELDHLFPNEHVYSAATSLTPPSSKPDPKIYLHACEQVGVKPNEVFTVEDSKSGATSAMRAGIACIGYVGVYGIEDGPEKMEQMAKLLKEECKCVSIMYDWKEFPERLREIEELLQ